MSPRLVSLLLLSTLILPGMALANPARDELLRYVPEDVGFCLVVQNLRGQLADLRQSPFFQKWSKTFLGPDTASERKKLAEFEKYIEKYLGISAKDIHDDILGDAFAFAYRPGPADKPGEEQGMFLIHSRDAKKLAKLIDTINKFQKLTGEIKGTSEKEYRDIRYVARRESKETTYYLLRGQVFLFTGQEPLLKRAIDCDRALAVKAKPPLTQRLEALQVDKALISLAIHPRAWDAAITAKATDESTKAVASHWKAVEGIGVGIYVERDVRLALTIKAKADKLPAATRRFLTAAGKPSTLWTSFPDDALFAMSHRLDLAALFDAVGEFLPAKSRKAFADDLALTVGAVLGKDVIKELLPALGPDIGVCITAPPAKGKQWSPNVILAVRVGAGDDDDSIDKAALAAVRTWAQLIVLGHNKQYPKKPMSLKTKTTDKVKIRFLSGDRFFPPGIEPAFALKSGHLVLASSPALLDRFAPPASAEKQTDVPLLRMSIKAWRTYLEDRRETIAAELAQRNHLPKSKALAGLDAVRSALEMVDRVDLRHRVSGGVASFTLTLTPSAALKK